jgi:hypothetical protein
MVGIPYEIRTRVTAVKGRCPRPLDERDKAISSRIAPGSAAGPEVLGSRASAANQPRNRQPTMAPGIVSRTPRPAL